MAKISFVPFVGIGFLVVVVGNKSPIPQQPINYETNPNPQTRIQPYRPIPRTMASAVAQPATPEPVQTIQPIQSAISGPGGLVAVTVPTTATVTRYQTPSGVLINPSATIAERCANLIVQGVKAPDICYRK